MPPWELAVIVAIPLLWHPFSGHGLVIDTVTYLAVAALALVIAVELHQFTAVRMTHTFAIGFVVLTTLSVAGVWNVLQWFADVALGTSFLLDGRSQAAINNDVMLEFVNAGVAGFGAESSSTCTFGRETGLRRNVPTFHRSRPRRSRRNRGAETQRPALSLSASPTPDQPGDAVRPRACPVLGTLCARPADDRQRRSCARDYLRSGPPRARVRPPRWTRGSSSWITTAVFLHALGTTGFYVTVGTWDTITHALSASIVAAAGYAFFRAVNVHTDHVHIPPTMMGVFILVFVLAAGVIWELFEFLVDWSAAQLELTPSSSSTVSMTRFATSSSTPSARWIVTLWGRPISLTSLTRFRSDWTAGPEPSESTIDIAIQIGPSDRFRNER